MRPSIPIPVSEARIKLLLTWRLLWFRLGRLVKSFFRAWGHGRWRYLFPFQVKDNPSLVLEDRQLPSVASWNISPPDSMAPPPHVSGDVDLHSFRHWPRWIASSSSSPALQNGRSQFVINGDWKISIPGEYNVAGTKLLYRRSADTWESFEVPGPTREDLHLMVRLLTCSWIVSPPGTVNCPTL